MENIFRMKRDADNRKRVLEKVHKRIKIGSEFSPTLCKFCLCFSRVAHGNRTQPNVAKREEINGAYASRIRWRRIVNVNLIIEIRSLVSRPQKHIKLAMASRRVASVTIHR